MCTCYKFEPNQWRRSLCKNCHHGFSAHASDVDDGGQWYFAKVRGQQRFAFVRCCGRTTTMRALQ